MGTQFNYKNNFTETTKNYYIAKVFLLHIPLQLQFFVILKCNTIP